MKIYLTMALILLIWVSIILLSILLFGLFVSIWCCIKEFINYCKRPRCCFICIENKTKNKKIELV
jgi:hypothetical protein